MCRRPYSNSCPILSYPHLVSLLNHKSNRAYCRYLNLDKQHYWHSPPLSICQFTGRGLEGKGDGLVQAILFLPHLKADGECGEDVDAVAAHIEAANGEHITCFLGKRKGK